MYNEEVVGARCGDSDMKAETEMIGTNSAMKGIVLFIITHYFY